MVLYGIEVWSGVRLYDHPNPEVVDPKSSRVKLGVVSVTFFWGEGSLLPLIGIHKNLVFILNTSNKKFFTFVYVNRSLSVTQVTGTPRKTFTQPHENGEF